MINNKIDLLFNMFSFFLFFREKVNGVNKIPFAKYENNTKTRGLVGIVSDIIGFGKTSPIASNPAANSANMIPMAIFF